MVHDVSVVGLYILDILGRPVDRIPDGGNVEFIDEIRLTVAGTAGGTAVDVAKLGLKTLAVGAVGDDEKADWMLATMQRHGIDTSMMQRLAGIPSSATILNVRRNGDRPALHVRGASDHFDVVEADYDRILAPPILHLGGTGLLRTLDSGRSLPLLAEARRRGRTVVFDLLAAHAGTLPLVEPLLPHIDYFMPSIEEAAAMSGTSSKEDAADFFLSRGVRCCVFTLGADGAYYANGDGTRFRRPAFAIDVVDTTGCGDAFDAGFIAALHHRMEPEEAVRFAQASAALVATGLGSDAGIVSFDETMRFARTAAMRD
jgi:sugar/nucleoside kinase (ribokinase family)